MKIPIPQDWDGESWECFEIQWPKSQNFRALLLGLLSQLLRGHAWDERTGDIRAIQAIAWQIWQANYPLVGCGEDCPECPECPELPECPECEDCPKPCQGGGVVIEEDDDMGQVVTDVTVENGHLTVWFGPCCSRDLGLLSDIAQTAEDPDIDPPWEDTGDGSVEPTYSACAKAHAVVNVVYNIVEAAISALEEFPWKYVSYIESTVGFDLDNKWIFALMADVALIAALDPPTTWNDPVEKQRIVCRVVALFGDNAAGVPTDAMFEQVKGCFRAEMQFDFWNTAFWYALNALGRHDMDTIAKTASLEDETLECGCPQAELFEGIGADRDWVYTWDLRESQGDWVITTPDTVRWTVGVGLWGKPGTTQNRATVYAELPFDNINNGSAIEEFAVLFKCQGDEDWDTNYVHFGTNYSDMMTASDIEAVAGNDPAVAGEHVAYRQFVINMGSNPVKFRLYLNAYHPIGSQLPDEYDSSQQILAVRIAGSGPGPLTAAPVWP